jgi:hypothetical protein
LTIYIILGLFYVGSMTLKSKCYYEMVIRWLDDA